MDRESAPRRTQWKGVLMLTLTAAIWGSAFVAQSIGMEEIEGFTFSGIRTLMAAAVLFPFVLVRAAAARRAPDAPPPEELKKRRRRGILYGVILGGVFCLAGNLQQFAFNDSSAGKIAFISALYMFFVPIFGLLIGKRTPWLTWVCAAVGFVGLYFLCIDPHNLGAINRGDVLSFFCAVGFAVHILLVERFSREADGVLLSCVQFAVAGVISCVLMFVFEQPGAEAIRRALPSLLYAGVLSCGVAYTFQILGQRYTEASVASLILCTESVFGALTSAFVLGERLRGREIFGCAVMFTAILLSQFSETITGKLRARREKRQ